MKKYMLGLGLLIALSIFFFLSIVPFILFASYWQIGLMILLIYYFLNFIFMFDAWSNKRSNKQSKKTWTFFLSLPFAFFWIYLLGAMLHKNRRDQLKESILLESEFYKNPFNKINNFNYEIDILVNGDQKFPLFFEDLNKAKESINFEYFIINNGIIWNNILQILIKKADEGVKVRVITDFVGNVQTANSSYNKLLNHPNIEFKIFNKVRLPFISGYSNLRNHHKIVVIDNKVGYFGGLNIGDDYAHMYSKYGFWFDLHFRTTDLLARELNRQFVLDWKLFNKKDIFKEYNLDTIDKSNKPKWEVETISDGYFYKQPLFLNAFIKCIDESEINIRIISPYLVFPQEIFDAFERAIKRNVNIQIITTGVADKRSAYFVSHYYSNKLIEMGVSVLRANNFFVHGKQYYFDDKHIILGTSNLDFRSLYLHFEHNFIFRNNEEFVQKNLKEVWYPLIDHSILLEVSNHQKLWPLVKLLSPIF